MDREKKIITLVGLRQAKKGFTFQNREPPQECEGCEFFEVCVAKLEVGRIYIVIAVREKRLPCKIHEEGVQAVEVVEPTIETNIEARSAFPSAIISFQSQMCDDTSCPNYRKCSPQGLISGDKCRIIEVREQTACPLSRRLVLARLQRVGD